MNRRAGFQMGLVALALTVFSGHAMAAECSTGPTAILGGPGTPVTGTVTGGLVVNGGDICVISGANVSGGVRVNPGGILVVCGSTINGGITSNGAAEFLVGPEELMCAGDHINGSVQVSNNGAGVIPMAPSIAIENSTLNGGIHLTHNAGLISVATNTIAGGLFCTNQPAPLTDEGSPSLITGAVTCEFGGDDGDGD
jgi:hypothetical protein